MLCVIAYLFYVSLAEIDPSAHSVLEHVLVPVWFCLILNFQLQTLQAQQMGLPITCADIINLPMDEFNDLLSKHELTEEQLTLCRDIRRRGKNKVIKISFIKNDEEMFWFFQVAAQNCRKRKIDQIKQLETEVTRIKCRKTELVTDHETLLKQRAQWSDLVKRLHDYVLKVNIIQIKSSLTKMQTSWRKSLLILIVWAL